MRRPRNRGRCPHAPPGWLPFGGDVTGIVKELPTYPPLGNEAQSRYSLERHDLSNQQPGLSNARSQSRETGGNLPDPGVRVVEHHGLRCQQC